VIRLAWTIYLSVMLVLCPGCSTWKAMQPPISSAPTYGPLPTRIRVVLWSREEFILHEPTIVRDSLFGIREVSAEVPSAMFFNESSRESCAIDMKQVRSLEERKPDTTRTLMLLIPVAVIIGLTVWSLATTDWDNY